MAAVERAPDSTATQAGARPARAALPHGPAVQLRKPAIALVLAGGPPHPGFGPAAPPFRPLLPVLGRPIVAHVLDALHASCVRRTLVFHDPACDIASAVDAGPKADFLPLPTTFTPIGKSVRYALEASVRACGVDAVRRSRLLILPCDLPFTTAAVIDRVLQRADALEFDFAYTAVSRGLLSQRYPGRPFRFYPAADLGGYYALQTATLVDGTFIHSPDDGTRVSFGDWTRDEADRLFENISVLREGRRSLWQVPQFVNELAFRRLRGSRGRRLIAATLARALVGRLRSTDVDRLTEAAFRARTVCVDTEAPELSADIDTPADLAFYLGVGGAAGLPQA